MGCIRPDLLLSCSCDVLLPLLALLDVAPFGHGPYGVHPRSQPEVHISFKGLIAGGYSVSTGNAQVASHCSSRYRMEVAKFVKTKPPEIASLELPISCRAWEPSSEGVANSKVPRRHLLPQLQALLQVVKEVGVVSSSRVPVCSMPSYPSRVSATTCGSLQVLRVVSFDCLGRAGGTLVLPCKFLSS
jgi:hypothetical protein